MKVQILSHAFTRGVAGFDSKARQVEVKILFDILARGGGIFDLS